MNDFIEWCNNNSGFISAILSIVGIMLSLIAIIVSIRTARLPYKRKIKVTSSTDLFFSFIPILNKSTSSIHGITINAINVGNRDVTITYLGILIKSKREKQKLFKINEEMKGNGLLRPTEMHSNTFLTKEILPGFMKLNNKAKAYAYVEDSENHSYKKYLGRARIIAQNMIDIR